MNDEPTVLTIDDINRCVEMWMTQEIPVHMCRKCSKKYIMDSYGYHIGECDGCWFSRFPKEEVDAFYRSFFE